MQATTAEKVLPVGPAYGLHIFNELAGGVDILRFVFSPEFRGIGLPHGDGAGVILVPGFMGSKALILYEIVDLWLRRIDYDTFHCGFGWNDDCPNRLTERLCAAIDRAFVITGRPVHLLGHSLGATLARVAAQRRPGRVATLISGAGTIRGARVHPAVHLWAEIIMPAECIEGCNCTFRLALLQGGPPKIPRLALYTLKDNVMMHQDCLEEEGGQNVQIDAARHISILTNPESAREIARFLAEHPAKKIAIA